MNFPDEDIADPTASREGRRQLPEGNRPPAETVNLAIKDLQTIIETLDDQANE